jgi:Right handed beta helix region/Secretion system C-terminal sorting domain
MITSLIYKISKVINNRKHLLLILLLGWTVSSHSQTPVPGGYVSGTWIASGSPYLVQGSIQIADGSTLTIEPGVMVNFQGHYKFVVYGRLLAIGNETNNIVITASNTSTGWYGLRFRSTSTTNDSSILEYCTLSYGKITAPDNSGGAISDNYVSNIRISHCLIQHNYASAYGGGIDIYNCDPVISNNTFDGNTADFLPASITGGGGLSLSESNSRITGNTFKNNSSNAGIGGGGAIFFSGGFPLIDNNIIINNSNTNNSYYGDGGGGGIFAYGTGTISNNTISNNSTGGYWGQGGGIYFYVNNNSTLVNNTITNNTAGSTNGGGGAIYCFINSSPVFTNNTIANNSTTGNGGALFCYSNSNPVFRNCIIYGNTDAQDTNQVYMYDEDCDPDFYYCDVQRGIAGFDLNGNFYTGHYENNINLNPVFVWPSQGSGTSYNGIDRDWNLISPSPCINSGDPAGTYPATDKSGNPRVINGIIDMGAYEYRWVVGIFGTSSRQHAVVCPNPFSNSTIIRFSTAITDGRLKISDATGQTIKIISDISGDQIKIERDGLPSGIYFYELLSENTRIASGKLVVIDN